MRTEAREVAFKVLFSQQFNEDNTEELKKALLKNLNEEDQQFANDLILCVNAHKDELLQIIDDNIIHFKENRLYAGDKCLLLIAVAEIKYFDSIPDVVSVNEAVNIANRYLSDKSVDFINGVLAGVIKK